MSATELILWGIPQGSNDAIDEKVLFTKALSWADIEHVKAIASKDGWHSFRVQVLDLEAMPDFKAEVQRAL